MSGQATVQTQTAARPTNTPLAIGVLQRQCACGQHTSAGSECESCRKKREGTLQRAAINPAPVHDVPPIVHEVLRSPGQPLDVETRTFMEPRFGHDFSGVRVHTNAKAAESTRAVNAMAYTVGPQIVFDTGRYVPGTVSGKNLLAHELTHVLQQSVGLARSATPTIGPANDEHEQQADAVAQAIVNVSGKSVSNRSWAHKAPFHQVSVGSGVRPVSRARLQRKTREEDELFGDVFGGETTKGAGGGDSDTKAVCPHVPTGRGDEVPEPQCPRGTHAGTTELKRFNFCLDSDELTNPGQLKEIDTTVRGVHPSTRFLVHGYASPEGKKDYNFRLACHRANRIAEAFRESLRGRLRSPKLSPEMLNAEVNSRVETASQGPTTEFGAAESNRVAVVFGQIPGRDEPEPGCDEAPRKIGDIKPEINCDVPSKDLAHMNGSQQLTHFHFCFDSDVLTGTSPTSINSFTHRQAASATFFVHGFSSVEGPADSNQRLSCHRALRVMRELINAGVKAEQIPEVSGLGETDLFGDAELNRVAVVFAEGGEISPVPGGKREAGTREEKEAVRDEARKRLMSGQYNLGADAYISFWTCGRTATVREAIERLTIEVKDTKDNENERLREQADGTEEGFGVNFVRLSNVALRSDNPIECTMGRIIDMAFHHAVLGDRGLSRDLIQSKDARHQAGLHLIHLAGLSACSGPRAQADVKRGDVPVGISEPLADDPRTIIPAPFCAQAPQPTRLHPPVKGAKDREAPTFEVSDSPVYTPATGKLITNFDPEAAGQSRSHLITKPENGMLTASADVQLKGKPETFADYEVGFIQTITNDEIQADYDSGHHVIQKLPVPIRLAAMKGEPLVAPPWTTADAMKRPGSDGKVSIKSTGSGLNSESAIALRELKATLPNSAMHSVEQGTRIAIWLIARRLGAPLDRFSIHFLDGVTYDLTQICHLEHRRIKGKLGDPRFAGGENEMPIFIGGFHASKPSLLPADPGLARFGGPIASEISLFNQVHSIVEPEAATDAGMGIPELTKVVADILDNLVLFDTEAEARKGAPGTKMPRLGFDFIPLTITLPIVRKTGRMLDPDKPQIITRVVGPGLGSAAGHALAEALEFRIKDRSFQGEDVVVRPSVVSDSGEVGNVTVSLAPLPKQADFKPEQESDLAKRADVLDNMAEGWACTELTASPAFISVGAREFGRAYWMDREKKFNADPSDHLVAGGEDKGEGFTTVLPCPARSDAVKLGSFHTHPEIQIPPEPSPADLKYAKDCGGQHFIVTDNKAFRYFPDGKVDPNPISLKKAPGCHQQNIDPIIKVLDD